MSEERLLTISTFGRAVGIPGSALRFYAAEQVLVPADIDPVTGYRYYAPAQIETGVLIGRMRAAGVPLPVMRDLLQTTTVDAVALVDELIERHRTDSQGRQLGLWALRDALLGARQPAQPALAICQGAVLASALGQVGAAAVGAAAEVSGVAWALRDGRLELSSTDRYWLAVRHIRVRHSVGSARVMTPPAEAAELAVACARRGEVRLEFTDAGLGLADPEGRLLAQAHHLEREVPDLGQLLSSQPPVRRTLGFPQDELAGFLQAEPGRVHLVIDGLRAEIVGGSGRGLEGWASGSGKPETLRVMLQAALFAAPVSVCEGPEVLLEVVDEATPVRVLSPLQDGLACLVMPMRP